MKGATAADANTKTATSNLLFKTIDSIMFKDGNTGTPSDTNGQ